MFPNNEVYLMRILGLLHRTGGICEDSLKRLLLVASSGVFFFLLVRNAWLCDDAYINFRVIDNFWNGYGLRWNIAERVQVYTSPLWLLILLILHSYFPSVYWLGIVVAMVTSLAAVTILARGYLKRSLLGASVLVTALGVSPFFVDFASSGLEQPLAYLLFACFLVELVKAQPCARVIGILAGCIMLTRLDYLLIVLPSLVSYFCSLVGVQKRSQLIVATLVLPCSWFAFSLIYYGVALPNTWYAKVSAAIPLSERLIQSGSYFHSSFEASPITFVLIVFSVVTSFRLEREKYIVIGIVLYFAYLASVGGDYMIGRFLALPTFLLVAFLMKRFEGRFNGYSCMAVVITLYCGHFSNDRPLFLEPQSERSIPKNGIIDEKFFDYQMSGLAVWSPKRSHDTHYNSRAGLFFRHERIKVEGAIGRIGYFAGPNCHIIDPLGIGDAFVARLVPSKENSRVGHLMRTIPVGYRESVLREENLLEEESARPLLQDVFLVTRAPLFSLDRWGAIFRLNLRRTADRD